MNAKPNRTYRSFFQFRLSTWLVLVGILAWMMACQPYWVPGYRGKGIPPDAWLLNPQFKWPALALVAFMGWKTFWLVRERRRERSTIATNSSAPRSPDCTIDSAG